jgi:hypothetical protein
MIRMARCKESSSESSRVEEEWRGEESSRGEERRGGERIGEDRRG